MPAFRFSHLLLLAFFCSSALGACKKEAKDGAPKVEAPHLDPSPVETAAPVVEEPEEAQQPKIEKPFFFRVTGPDGAAGHLLGTMHMGIDAAEEFPPSIWTALDAATIVAVEADISDLSLVKGLMLPSDTNLKILLGDEYWAKLEKAIGALMANGIKPMKPAAAASMLSMKDLPQTVPMDLLIMNKAKAAKQDLQFLEAAQFQLDLLDQVMTIDYLKEMLDNPDPEATVELLEVYRAGDLERLEALSNDTKAWGKEADAEKNMELMLYKRNEDWIPKIKKMLASKSAFVAVGAAHLIGPRGLLELLRKEGYTVERLPAE